MIWRYTTLDREAAKILIQDKACNFSPFKKSCHGKQHRLEKAMYLYNQKDQKPHLRHSINDPLATVGK